MLALQLVGIALLDVQESNLVATGEYKVFLASCLHVVPSKEELCSQRFAISTRHAPMLTRPLNPRHKREKMLYLEKDTVSIWRPRDEDMPDEIQVRLPILAEHAASGMYSCFAAMRTFASHVVLLGI